MAAQGESGSDLFLCKLDFLLIHFQMLLWKEFFSALAENNKIIIEAVRRRVEWEIGMKNLIESQAQVEA